MDTGRQVLRESTMLLLATTATEPWLLQVEDIRHNPIVLHLSLRDLSPDLVTYSYNVVDDIEHCLQANTSLHLASQASASRGFISGTLVEVMDGACRIGSGPANHFFSPFGLGVLGMRPWPSSSSMRLAPLERWPNFRISLARKADDPEAQGTIEFTLEAVEAACRLIDFD